MSARQVEQILNAVLDAGINVIDTANDYGTSEGFIGRFVRHRRQEFYLATKCGCPVSIDGQARPPGHMWTREHLVRNIETSLRHMKTDHVDVWQLHNPSVAHEDVITAAAGAGGGTIIRGGVARGAPSLQRWLRVRLGLRRGDAWAIWAKANLDELRAAGESRTSFLLRFTLSHPGVHTTIVGTINPKHLAENVRAVETGPLSSDVYAEAKRRLDVAGERPASAHSDAI